MKSEMAKNHKFCRNFYAASANLLETYPETSDRNERPGPGAYETDVSLQVSRLEK
jgi:hypothetical protein